MAKTIHSGYYLAAGAATETLHTAAGRLLAVLISHAQAAVQTVSFYNNTAAFAGTQILVISIHPDASPFYLELPRHAGIEFDSALHVDQGNCHVSVWSVDGG
jgi:hypothetical protein